MKVLVIGSGGREHAICWKLAQSERVNKIFAIPGNGGIAQLAECTDIKTDAIEGIVDFAQEKEIDITIIGPEATLAAGIVNKFNKKGLRIFGPDIEMAKLEASKVFAKQTMARFKIPTANFAIFDNPDEAKQHINKRGTPMVVKADGLAAGKGSIICQKKKEAIDAVKMIMVDKKFGPSGDRVIIEDCLVGEEASIIVISDGMHFVNLASSQDHKRIYDGDSGPNTGGMGAYSPAPVIDDVMNNHIQDKIVKPLIFQLHEEGTPFKGVLYVGIMITKDGPLVLEFNVRFGDPETQAIFPRLKSDLMDAIEASIDGNIENVKLEWDQRPCVCVVCASGGYPGKYKKGIPIYGLDETAKLEDVVVFHAGTKQTRYEIRDMKYETNGGRVLGVTALGRNIKAAIDKTYQACGKISFEGIYYRRDIGYRALRREGLRIKDYSRKT
ncbi:MAG: phosphoribosylamine--glycine ligase [Candidatus Omnitrophota bacterium]|nr:MAG: phosphoribosylamine--glycine ligase [Candidatus Omnitrophota bacterium]